MRRKENIKNLLWHLYVPPSTKSGHRQRTAFRAKFDNDWGVFESEVKPLNKVCGRSRVWYRSAHLQVGTLPSSACSPEGERYSTSSETEPPSKPAVEVSPFVSENDVRRAMTRSEKIFIGRKTILTPSARDLGLEHEVFVETEAGSIR
jgi:hypothetical protein